MIFLIWVLTLGGNDHLIEFNEFHHVGEEFADMGAIYFNTGKNLAARGTVIRNNFFHHIGLGNKTKRVGIYVDWCSMGIEIVENVFYKIGDNSGDVWAVMNNGGNYVNTRNNVFVDCMIPYRMSYWLNGWGKDCVAGLVEAWKDFCEQYDLESIPHAKRYPEILRFWQEDHVVPVSNVFEGNLVFNPTVSLKEREYIVDYAPVEKLDPRNNWVADVDPGFEDVEAMDFDLKRDAVVFEKIAGFKSIDFGKIGLKD